MYFRNRFSSASGNPRMSRRSSRNCSLIDSLSRIRMTASSPLHARHDRHAEVDRLARHLQLEAAVLRHALLGDVELGHDLDARDDRAVELLRDRPHRRLQHAVDAVLHVHRVVAGLDVDVARAPLNGREDRRIDELDDRADVAREPLDGEVLVEVVVVLEELNLEALGRLFEHALRALALLEDRLDRRPRADRHRDRRAEQLRQLVEHRQVGRVRDHDDERLALALVRHERVPQHQIRGNRPEQLLIDREVIHVDEFEPIPLGQALRGLVLGAALFGGDGSLGFRHRYLVIG